MIQTLGAREIILGILILCVLSQIISRTAVLCVLLVGMYYVSDYKNINRTVKDLFGGLTNEGKPSLTYTENSRKHKITVNESMENPDLIKLLNKLKKYRKYNKISYDKGYKHMMQFLYLLRHIQHDIPNSRDIYDNAELSYKSAIKEFQSLGVAVPSYDYQRSFSKPEESHKTYPDYAEKIGSICKRLNDLCYYMLYRMSLQINADWIRDPSANKSEIIQTDIEPANMISHHYIF